MFITPAYAQSAAGGGINPLLELLPMVLAVGLIMYFMVYRPQKRQMKEREAMLGAVRRNDTIVTGGGIVGKVTKVIDDHEVEVQISPDVKVRLMRSHIADVRTKGEAKAEPAKAVAKADNDEASEDAPKPPAKPTRRRRSKA